MNFLFDLDPTVNPVEQPKRAGAERSTRMRNVKVTERNVSEVPLDWLQVRMHRLTRWINESQKPKLEWQEELELVKAALDARNKHEVLEQQMVEQLELEGISINPRESYVPIVEERLRAYYRMTQEYAWHKRQLEEMIKDNALMEQFPVKIVDSQPEIYKLQKARISEKQANLMVLEENMLAVKTILHTRLNEEQYKLVQHKYLTRECPKDQFLIMKFHMGRQKYYNLKNGALTKIAYELGLI